MASNVKYNIKDNYTLPPIARKGRPVIYPFGDMKVGQTAIFEDVKTTKQIQRIRGAVSSTMQRLNIRLSTRWIKDTGQFAVQRVRANA